MNRISRLRQCSADELRVRALQALAIGAERSGLDRGTRVRDTTDFARFALDPEIVGRNPDPARLLDLFRGHGRPAFFSAFRTPGKVLGLLRLRWPDIEGETIAAADRICAGEFSLLGRSRLALGSPPDWHRDPLSGAVPPLRHWSRVDHLDPAVAGEYKLIWELNRHQHLTVLGRAYWYSGDERYAEAFVGHLDSWMATNPPGRGINWSSSLELSLRSIAWVWALHFFRHSPALTPEVYARALQLLHLQGRHIERYLSTYYSPNTHLTGEALGLFYLGLLFPELRSAPRWRAKGLAILLDQLPRQVRGDGVYFEQSTFYHRYTTDIYLHLVILARENALELDEMVECTLRRLLDHLMYLTRPDGRTPLLGDDDGGRLLPLDSRCPQDFRTTLATGAAVFGAADYRFVAGEPTQEVLWLLGPRGLRDLHALTARVPADCSRPFHDGGYFVMRDGWAQDSSYLLVDCGPHGSLRCGHAHADTLAIELTVGGTPFLVDSGTYTYRFPETLRDALRSSLAHNTLSLDGESSSLPAGPFDWKSIARSSVRLWLARSRFDFFAGEHDGYRRLPDPATHARAVLFLKGDYWIVHDRISARGAHQAELRFHFAPGIRIREHRDGLAAIPEPAASSDGRVRLDVHFPDAQVKPRLEEGWVSGGYGERAAAKVASLTVPIEGDRDIVSFLIPRGTAAKRLSVRAVPASGGRAYRLCGGSGDDLFFLSSGGVVRCKDLETDFAWGWLRKGSDDQLEELVLIDGRFLVVEGHEVLRSPTRIGFLSVGGAGRDLRIDGELPDGVKVRVPGADAARSRAKGPRGDAAPVGSPFTVAG